LVLNTVAGTGNESNIVSPLNTQNLYN